MWKTHARALLAAAVGFSMAACSNASAPAASAPAGNDAVGALSRAQVGERLAEREKPAAGATGQSPHFVVDPAWPKPLPNNWIIGDVGGLYVDRHDNIWVYHRPRSITSTDAGALGEAAKDERGRPISVLGHPRPYGQLSGCCIPAPSVLKFDKAGNLLDAWGGPGDPGFLETKCRVQDGCTWPAREHGIYVDQNDFVWVAGNGQAVNFHGQYPWAPNFGNDSQVLKFKADGTFVLQIGTPGMKGPNSNDTNGGINGTPQPFLPADMTVDPKTNRLYIADGYGNSRVLIVDAETGKYVGHFGAYGQNPVKDTAGAITEGLGEGVGPWAADYRKGELKPNFFRSPLHCAKISNDGKLYACDRGNNRVQIFDAAKVGGPCENPTGEVGKCGFLGEIAVAPQTASGTAGTLNFSTDETQSCAYVADLTNNTVYAINRDNLQEMSRFGAAGSGAGQFHWPHVVSVDTDGNVYTGEVDGSARIQKFLRFGPTGCSGTGNPKVGEYRPAAAQ
jgi:DNA-binding beta-propeller fold protein YncE